MIKNLYDRIFMYGFYPRPFQKIIGFFIGKPLYIQLEEVALAWVDGMQRSVVPKSKRKKKAIIKPEAK